jgi:hypothetical protein
MSEEKSFTELRSGGKRTWDTCTNSSKSHANLLTTININDQSKKWF